MRTIGIIGGDGFIGSNIGRILGGVSITRNNYDTHKETEFDVLINANGNSKKYWANKNPIEDFDMSVMSVYKSLFDFKYKKYVYISSVDVEEVKTHYGFHKYLAEEIVKRHCKDYSVVRVPLVIGTGCTKGVVNDILNGDEVYLTSCSTLMIVDIKEVIARLELNLWRDELGELERFYPSRNIAVHKIGYLLGKDIKYADDLRYERYDYQGIFKDSEFYLKDYK